MSNTDATTTDTKAHLLATGYQLIAKKKVLPLLV